MMSADTLYRAARTRLPLAVLAVLAACSGDKTQDGSSALTGRDAPSLAVAKPNQQDWKQCKNNQSFDSQCEWITGNLTATQNVYREGDVVPHILRLSGITNSDPIVVELTYGFKKGNKSTYDFLAEYDFTMTKANPCTDGTFTAFCSGGVLQGAPVFSNIIPQPDMTKADSGFYSAAVTAYGQKLGGPASTLGKVRVSALNATTVSAAKPVLDNVTGQDVEVTIAITVVPAAGKSEVLLMVGSHVARGADWTAFGGASSVPGSPYHLALVSVGGTTTGSMDLQMASNTIIPDTRLTLVKTVTNDNGGTLTAANFPLSAAGPTPITNVQSGTATTVNPGVYALSEQADPNYTAGQWSCTGTGGTLSGSSVTLAEGADVTCTINNDDKAGSLQLVKVVKNDNGGTATAASFGITTNATASALTWTPLGSAPTITYTSQKITVSAGAYTFSEQDLSGYAEGTWSCTGATAAGTAFGAGSVTVPLNTAVVCTITNDDDQGSLTLVKRVINDNGGTAAIGDFAIASTAGTPAFTSIVNGALTTYTSAPIAVNAGPYTLVEKDLAGYAEGTWSCTSGLTSGTATAGSVTVAPSTNVVCTIENNDIAPRLTLIKVVVNDNGGLKTVSDFALTATGPQTITGISGAATITNAAVPAGSYTLSEVTQAGYTASAWVCTGTGTQNGSSISLALAQSATCTITNNDVPATLTLVKVVTNDNGGTRTVADFPLTADGPTKVTGVSGTAAVTAVSINPGIYTLSEVTRPDYTASAWACKDGNNNALVVTADAKLTLAAGQSATCLITNDDKAPKLQLIKQVINDNGGTATPASFTLSASGGPSPISGAGGVTSGATFKAGTYSLAETAAAGVLSAYTASSWTCTGGTQSGASIAVALGESAVCTITNNDKPGTLIVTKVVKGEGSTFNFTVSGPSLASVSNGIAVAANGSNSRRYSDLNAGAYSVAETTVDGYVLTDLSCDVATTAASLTTASLTVSVPNGGTVTCTFVNNGAKTTRTQGFWQTHTGLLNVALFGGQAGGITVPSAWADLDVCNVTVTSKELALGGFWSNVARTTTGLKRTDLGQARMLLAQQLMAAIANSNFFGSAPSGAYSIAQAQAVCRGTDVTAIKAAMSAMAAFNEGGDAGIFTPGASADAKNARSIALLPPWDVNN